MFFFGGSTGGKEAIAKADLPNIRLYHVPKVQAKTPAKDIKTNWKVCSPETSPKFSAVLFFFGRRLHDELKIPIGLINNAWGTTAAGITAGSDTTKAVFAEVDIPTAFGEVIRVIKVGIYIA